MTPLVTHAVLGLACDRGAWPEAANGALEDGTAAAGAPVLGPLGLLRVLETALGLAAPEVPHATRLAAWRAKLAATAEGRFWAESFAQDPLATAETLLAWRDSLVEAGWDARAAQPGQRLADLAAAEAAEPALPAGPADRLRAALAELATAPLGTPVPALRLLDERDTLPPGLARLVGALEGRGTTVEEVEEPFSPARGDLGAAQDALRLGAGTQLAGDGSFALLTAETETAAAEVLADWLAAGGAQGRTVIVADRPTAALDAALARRHLPALGHARASTQRGVLQLLPLVLATRWRPFDAARMLQLLQARPSPLPRELRRTMAEALVAAPGRDGPAWTGAIASGLAALADRLAAEEVAEPERKAAPRLTRAKQRVAALVEAPLRDPESGMPVEELCALCGLLAAWAAEQGEGEDLLFTALAGAARALAEAAEAGGRPSLTRVEVERLLAAALDPGILNPEVTEEAAPWQVLRDPAAMWDYADTVVWWGLGEPSLPPRRPWTKAELSALEAAGCALADPTETLAALSRGWRRPVLLARQRALLVVVPQPGDAGGRRHPLLDELLEVLLGAPPTVRPVAEPLLGDPAATLMGTRLARTELDRHVLPQPRAEWQVPKAALRPRPVESATSIEALLGCPYAWVARYAAGLRPGRAAEVPQGSQLIGLIAHRLAQELFPPGPPQDPAAVRAAAETRLLTLLDEMGAPLLAPGAAAELARLRAELPAAMQVLATLLAQHGLSVVETEARREAADVPEVGQRLTGQIDMLLVRPNGSPAVIDLKWAGSDRWRRAEVEEGRAVQLAAYVGLVGAGEDAGFFMLAQRRMVAGPDSLFGGRPAPGLRDTWQGALEARRLRLATISDGTLRALGLEEREDDPDGAVVTATPPCRFCDQGRLCGKEAVR
jgi:RecB family exonuclease